MKMGSIFLIIREMKIQNYETLLHMQDMKMVIFLKKKIKVLERMRRIWNVCVEPCRFTPEDRMASPQITRC